MERVNSLRMRAPRQRIFDLASKVEHWPDLLPHYRWVKMRRQLGDGRRIVEMAAMRDIIPVRWVAIEGQDPDSGVITFQHIGGPTTGMAVQWTLRDAESSVEASIYHHFAPAWPKPLGPWLAQHVVGELFISNIADKTLAHIKRIAESPHAPDGRPWLDV